MMVNKFTTTNKTNNQLSPRTIEHQNDHEIWRWKSRSKNVVEIGVVLLTWNFVLIGQNIIQNNTIAHSVLYHSIICCITDFGNWKSNVIYRCQNVGHTLMLLKHAGYVEHELLILPITPLFCGVLLLNF